MQGPIIIITVWVKAHYSDPPGGVTLYYFLRICMFECIPPQTFKSISQYFCILWYNLGKILKYIYFISFYKVQNWSIICGNKCNVHVYPKTQIYSKNYLNDFQSLWKLKLYWTMSFHIVWTMFGYHVINLKFFISKNVINVW